MVAPAFVDISATEEGVDLTKLVVAGDFASNDIVIQTLTTDGYADKTYTYSKPRRGDWQWVDDDNAPVSEGEVFFKAGTGLWIAGVDGSLITTAGQVSTDDRTIALVNGAVACGNSTAVPLDLLSIIPSGDKPMGTVPRRALQDRAPARTRLRGDAEQQMPARHGRDHRGEGVGNGRRALP